MKILILLFETLSKFENLNSLLNDFFVVSTLLSYSYYLLQEISFDKFKDLNVKLLVKGLQANENKHFKQIFYDFYLIIYFDFQVISEDIEK